LTMRARGRLLGMNVLDQRASREDVENLTAVTNGKHGLSRVGGVLEDGDISTVAVLVYSVCFDVLGSSVAGGIDVRRAAWENKGIQIFELRRQRFWTLQQRDFDGIGARFADGGEIIVEFAALGGALLIAGAPRNADSRAVAGRGRARTVGGGIRRVHGT